MPFSIYALDYQLTQWAANHGLYISVHSAYSATGANELSGGTYARLAAAWGTAAGGSISLTGTYNFNAPASSTCAFIGFWDAATGGNFQQMIPAGAASAYAFAAPASTDILLAPGSAYAANATVCVFLTGGATLPSPLVAGTIYYVKSPSSDSFELATTSGGTAINLTADGSGYVQGITPEVYGSAGTFTVSSGTITSV